jgi:hypothetical protein
MAWRKAINIGKTPTLTKLYEAIKGLAVSVGTQDFAICLIPAAKIDALQSKLRQIYGERITPDFIDSIAHKNRPLVVVSVAGFKPRGDDSRPDRGLLPLARMLFGEEDVNVLSIIYGPAKDPGAVINDPPKAAKTNGLWESIIRFSTAFLLDSTTSLNLKQISAVIPKREEAKPTPKPKLPAGGTNPIRFGEHDVDSALHTIFSRMLENVCFECICNPPGGDWSGFSMQIEDSIYRWTSLPRVTATKEKRPDHAIQFKASRTFFLTIESKDSAGSVEPNIGPRLRQYVKSLLQFSPTICRNSNKCSQWGPFQGELKFTVLNIVTAAAFRLSALEELDGVLSKGKCDIVIGFVFDKEKETTKLHFKANGDFTEIKGALQTAASQSACRLIIHIH